MIVGRLTGGTAFRLGDGSIWMRIDERSERTWGIVTRWAVVLRGVGRFWKVGSRAMLDSPREVIWRRDGSYVLWGDSRHTELRDDGILVNMANVEVAEFGMIQDVVLSVE